MAAVCVNRWWHQLCEFESQGEQSKLKTCANTITFGSATRPLLAVSPTYTRVRKLLKPIAKVTEGGVLGHDVSEKTFALETCSAKGKKKIHFPPFSVRSLTKISTPVKFYNHCLHIHARTRIHMPLRTNTFLGGPRWAQLQKKCAKSNENKT